MRKGKIAFERIPLEEVRRILKQQNNAEQRAQELIKGDKPSKLIPHHHTAKNVQKRPARPKRSIRTAGDDHPLGLWIDMEIFRRHQNRPPQIALHNPMLNSNNRYLVLADSVLTHKKSKPKREASDNPWRAGA